MRLAVHALRSLWAYHTWIGVTVGLVLHVMILTGAIALFLEPLKIWEEPVQHRAARETLAASPQQLFDRGRAAIADLPGQPRRLWLGLPQGEDGVARFQYSDLKTGLWRAGWLDPESGAMVPEREQLAMFLYHLHYLWHPALPELEYLAGLIAVAFLLAVVTGVVIHLGDFLRQLYQFRPGAGRRVLWSDMHKVLGVMGLPFQLVFSYTGALLVFGPVLITALAGPVFGGDAARESRIAWNEPASLAGARNAAPVRSLDEILATARQELPGFAPISFGVQGHGGPAGLVRAYGKLEGRGEMSYANVLVAQHGGAVLHIDEPSRDLASHATRRWLYGLHYVYFGGPALRVLLAVLALAACGSILTGNWVYLARRRRNASGAAGPAGAPPARLARLTAGVGAGSFVAIASLFVASRVLPLDLAGRVAAEQLIFAGALAACIAWAMVARRIDDLWWKQLGLAGAMLVTVPLWAARISPAGLFGGGPRVSTVVAVDAAVLGCGAALLAVAWALRRARHAAGMAERAGAEGAAVAAPSGEL